MKFRISMMGYFLPVLCTLASIAAADPIVKFPLPVSRLNSKNEKFELAINASVFNKDGKQISKVVFQKAAEAIEVPFGEAGEIILEGKGKFFLETNNIVSGELKFEVSWPYWFEGGKIKFGEPGIPNFYHSRGFHNYSFKKYSNPLSVGDVSLSFLAVHQETSLYELIDIGTGQDTEGLSIGLGPISGSLTPPDDHGFRKTGVAPELRIIVKH